MSRYDRQIRLEEVGILGQKKLAQARVLCIGAGGLSSPILYYLASAGIGTIAILDGDTVDLSNLQRQILFTENDQGIAKALAAKIRLEQLNSELNIIAITENLTEENADSLIELYDLIIDGTDNFTAKFLINKTAKKLNKPWVYASVSGFEGQLAFFHPQGSCLQCLIPKIPKQNQFSCAEAGVLGPMVGWIGSIQALEAIRYFINTDNSHLASQLLFIDAWSYTQKKIKIPQQEACPICRASQDLVTVENPKEVNSADIEQNTTELNSEENISPIKINTKNYFLVDLCDKNTEQLVTADFQYSLSDLFTQEEIPIKLRESKKPLLFYCENGYKSLSALSYLNALGFENISHLDGGLASWKKFDDTHLIRIEE